MVRPFALCMLVLLSACAAGGGIQPGREHSLAVDERAALPDGSVLHYLGIVNDSRCPANVQCIRAGDADVLFAYAGRNAPSVRITLNTERTRSATLGRWQLDLVALDPGPTPRATLRIEAITGGIQP
ncbi:hypothetical protein [Lysobacter solisilvae (ex Woo and Kim 2020)]|uniref:Lipoprotein n=1 Tax=Agrilutibacter terrestris TaxID=2865112 RepID=A0A7H0FVQ0_9GAMM|nr:hypothetical protein [Lysobacter terrestris]QNP40116.1 hypothetical protein H8B22_11515 [Lysobacter terrestris]